MWIIIIAIIVIIGFFIFKHFDRDFIKAVYFTEREYFLHFENGKKPRCELVDTIKYNEKDYYIFIPVESLKNVPLEDVIVLELYKKKSDELIFVFADKESDKIIMKALINRYSKNKYGKKYNFAFLNK